MSGTVSRVRLAAVGTSLGGLDALRIVLSQVRLGAQLAIVIAQHRTPQADTALVELLASSCALPVCEPCDRDPIEPGRVYVAPPDYHMLVEPGAISLSVDAPENYARPSIDILFESAAAAYGSQAAAFVLTGSSADGAVGAAAIKRAGGLVYLEDPEHAHSPIAPRAALEATSADAVLSLPLLAELLAELALPRA